MYIIWIILVLGILYIGYYIKNFNDNKSNKSKIRKNILCIQKFLNDENKNIKFTSNDININGKYDTNFKVSLYNYLEFIGLFIDNKNNIENEINQIFLIAEISMKDITNLIDIILLANKKILNYVENN